MKRPKKKRLAISVRYCTEAYFVWPQLSGNIVAPETKSGYSGYHTNTWLGFSYVNGLIISGKGTIDGRGSAWWSQSCLRNSSSVSKFYPFNCPLTFYPNNWNQCFPHYDWPNCCIFLLMQGAKCRGPTVSISYFLTLHFICQWFVWEKSSFLLIFVVKFTVYPTFFNHRLIFLTSMLCF